MKAFMLGIYRECRTVFQIDSYSKNSYKQIVEKEKIGKKKTKLVCMFKQVHFFFYN